MVDSSHLKQIILSLYKEVELVKRNQKVEQLIIRSNYGNKMRRDLIISNYPQLNLIEVGDMSLQNVRSVKICDNPQLKKVIIGKRSFFSVYDSLTLEGMSFGWIQIRSSSTDFSYYGRCFVQKNKECEFKQ